MDIEQIKEWTFYMQAAQFAFMIAGFVWVAVSNRQKANTTAIEELTKQTAQAITDLTKETGAAIKELRADIDDETEQLGNRLTRLEAQIEHMPGHEDLGEIHNRVNEAAQRLTSMEGELKQMNNTMQLMHRHLMSGGTNREL